MRGFEHVLSRCLAPVHHDNANEALCCRRSRSTDDPGLCLTCGADADGVEPDAQGYDCESCDAPTAYGYEELMMMNFNR